MEGKDETERHKIFIKIMPKNDVYDYNMYTMRMMYVFMMDMTMMYTIYLLPVMYLNDPDNNSYGKDVYFVGVVDYVYVVCKVMCM